MHANEPMHISLSKGIRIKMSKIYQLCPHSNWPDTSHDCLFNRFFTNRKRMSTLRSKRSCQRYCRTDSFALLRCDWQYRNILKADRKRKQSFGANHRRLDSFGKSLHVLPRRHNRMVLEYCLKCV
jgi:hypothetical protein